MSLNRSSSSNGDMMRQIEAALAVLSDGRHGQSNMDTRVSAAAFQPEEADEDEGDECDGVPQPKPKKKQSMKYPSIRLSRSASARTMAVIEHNKMRALREAEREAEHAEKLAERLAVGIPVGSLELGPSLTKATPVDANSDKPKLGNAAALDLIRRIYEQAEVEYDPIGHSDSDKVSSLQIGFASNILEVLTWREFFDGKSIKAKKREMAAEAAREANKRATRIEDIKASRLHNKMHYLEKTLRPQGSQEQSSPNSPSPPPSTPSSPMKRRIEKIRMQRTADTDSANFGAPPSCGPSRLEVFHSLCLRIETLWAELKMSPADVSFFRRSLLTVPSSNAHCSEQHIVELARYLSLLQDHKLATVKAVYAYQVREGSLASLRDVLERIDAWEGEAFYEPRVPSSLVEDMRALDLFGTAIEFCSDEGGGNGSGGGGGRAMTAALVAELAFAVKDVQSATLNLIRRVLKWRKLLWRPRAFMIVDDQGREVDCFLKMQTDARDLLAGRSGNGGQLGYFACLSEVPLFPCDLACVIFTPDVESSKADLTAYMHSPDWLGLDLSLREAFFDAAPKRGELVAAHRLVLNHESVQQMLKQELKALLSRKVFIPTLKVPLSSSTMSSDTVAGLFYEEEPSTTKGGAPPTTESTQVYNYAEPVLRDRDERDEPLLPGGLLEDGHVYRAVTIGIDAATPGSSPPIYSREQTTGINMSSPAAIRLNSRARLRLLDGKVRKGQKVMKPLKQPMPRNPDDGKTRECCHEADFANRSLKEKQDRERAEELGKIVKIRKGTGAGSRLPSPSQSFSPNLSPSPNSSL